MEKLYIESTNETPEVNFTSEGKLSLKGRSIPEQAHDFYKPLLQWIEKYSENPAAETVFELFLDYCNSFSRKHVLDLLRIMKELESKEKKVTVNWFYEEDDEELEKEAQLMSKILNLHINTIEVQNEDD